MERIRRNNRMRNGGEITGKRSKSSGTIVMSKPVGGGTWDECWPDPDYGWRDPGDGS